MTTRENGSPDGFRGPQSMTYERQAEITPVLGPQQAVCIPPKLRPLNPKSKRAAVLRVFLDRGAVGMNCFEAVRLAHDYVLRTTVSECVRYHGIQFAKKYESIPGHAGSTVDCVRYSLTSEGAGMVRELLGESLKAAA